jgi:hypothetical protein
MSVPRIPEHLELPLAVALLALGLASLIVALAVAVS